MHAPDTLAMSHLLLRHAPPCAPPTPPAGKAMWDAWDKQKGKSSEAAMQEYIELVASLKAKYA